MNIEIRKIQASSGIEVWVDGEKWANGFKNSRGSHGYFYEFSDMEHRTVRNANGRREWQVWSDKTAARRSGVSADKIEPFEKRLPQEIFQMIDVGALRSPAKCREDAESRRLRFEESERRQAEENAESRRLRFEESERRQAEEKDRLFGEKADRALAPWRASIATSSAYAGLKANIVEAMKWARSH